jgi:hypothetical protein
LMFILENRVPTGLINQKNRKDFVGPTMLHRHLNHEKFTLAAIDDVIGRGKRQDWAELRCAVLRDQTLLEKVLRVCKAHVADPYAQRYHFWKQYAERQLA